MLLTKISGANWKTELARKTSEGRFIVTDPTRFYDVHMEIGVKLGKATLELLVHHETLALQRRPGGRNVLPAKVRKRYPAGDQHADR